MSKILFSYRPTDSKSRQIAAKVLERLNYNYGREDVHTDINSINGSDRRSYIEDFLVPIRVLIMIIGPNWVNSRARNGGRRLDDSEDIVRLEIETALTKGTPVIPILVRGARMPEVQELPDGMKLLAAISPLPFGSESDFRGDMMKLHRRLVPYLVEQDARQTTATPINTTPNQARKDLLNEAARIRLLAHKAPFEGVKIDTLGEVLWILGAQSGRLGTLYGERRFPPDLSGADISYVNLSGATLSGSKLLGAKLIQANLSAADLSGALLAGADLTEANLRNARLDNAVLASAQLQLADLSACSMQATDLSDVNLTTTTLTNAVMNVAIMQRANLGGLALPNALLTGADFTSADLRDASLPRAQMEGVKLEEAKLNGADLSGAKLLGADLSRASLDRTDLSSADLSATTIGSVDELKSVIIDGNTRFNEVKWGGRLVMQPRKIKDREQRLRAYRLAAQTNHEIAEMLREGGFLAEASSYRLAEQRMRRGILRNTQRYGAWLFSYLLNIMSGYGERLGRTLSTYVAVILGFATLYFLGANYFGLEAARLSPYQAIILSVVSFHGRGFVSSFLQLGDPMSGITVVESVIGLLIEAIIIATFSRRFLGD